MSSKCHQQQLYVEPAKSNNRSPENYLLDTRAWFFRVDIR